MSEFKDRQILQALLLSFRKRVINSGVIKEFGWLFLIVMKLHLYISDFKDR
tara:strand:- start:486 stop:638 length:153 start_codon:yes stop_codon:yes gene_type:complete